MKILTFKKLKLKLPGISALISLLECRDDVSSHLKYYQLSSEILEYKLILFRSGL